MSYVMSNPSGLRNPAAPSSRRQAVFGIAVLVVLVVLSLARALSSAFTDYLWFSEDVGYASVWRTVWGTKVVLGVVFAFVFGMMLWINLRIAQKSHGLTISYAVDQPGLARLSDVIEQRESMFRTVVSVAIGCLGGLAFAGRWQEWLLFKNSTTVGIKDPQFSKDLSFYFFQLPFLSALTAWLFATVFVVLVFTVAVYVLNGSIRFDGRFPRIFPRVRPHLSVLVAILALLRATRYWIQRYGLTVSESGFVRGAGYTDVKARVPALMLLTFVSVTVALLLLVSIRNSGWTLPVVGIAVWIAVSLVAGAIYPAIVQALVKSNQLDRERKYIVRNIEATSTAMGLDNIKRVGLDVAGAGESTASPKLSAQEEGTLQNLRIWEPSADIARQAFTRIQQNIDVYLFKDVDIDRYRINGKLVPVAVAARELDESSKNFSSWIQKRLGNTHGNGVVIAAANTADPKGAPEFLSDGRSPTKAFPVKKSQIYFGEGTNGYVVVGTKTPEVDGKDATTSFSGRGGVALSNPLRRFAFALRFADANMLISSQVKSESQILYVRNIRKRAEKLAPFFHYDNDPYPVLSGGRILWILDAYTTSDRFPYGETANTDSVSSDSGLFHRFNYVRNPVKVVVDAYDGTVKFFVYEPNGSPSPKLKKRGISSDPITRAIAGAFPGLLKSEADLARLYPGLSDHFRYPEDLFKVQAQMIGRYQVTEPGAFFQGAARWVVATAPADKLDQKEPDPTAVVPVTTSGRSMRPYYLLAALPDGKKQEFFLQTNLVPYSGQGSQQNLRALFIAPSDPENYGNLRMYTVPSATEVSGPRLVATAMSSDRRISEKENLLGGGGSSLYYGSVQVLPIGKSVLYVRPMFVRAEDNYPIYTYMAVSYRGNIGFGPSLKDALAEVGLAPTAISGSASATGASSGEPSSSEGAGAASGTDVLKQIDSALQDAQRALDAGDLATYQAKVNLARSLVGKAVASGTIAVPGKAKSPVTSTTVAK